MLQETFQQGWDLRNIHREPSTSLKLYVFFLLVGCVVTSMELIKAWRVAPPFRISRQISNASYLNGLEASRTRLKQWIFFTILVWGILTSTSVYDVSNGLLAEKKISSGAVLFVLQDYATTLTMALLVILFAFLVRWHLVSRINYLRKKVDRF
jgi:hypothetical protein